MVRFQNDLVRRCQEVTLIMDSLRNSDAKRPACSTCQRSHAYAARLAHPAVIPPMECSFDDFPAFEAPESNEPQQVRFERLETRISEHECPACTPDGLRSPCQLDQLEALLRGSAGIEAGSSTPITHAAPSPSVNEYYTQASVQPQAGPSSGPMLDVQHAVAMDPPTSGLPMMFASMIGPTTTAPSDASFAASPMGGEVLHSSLTYSVNKLPHSGISYYEDMSLTHPAWPMYLPPPELLNHLVDTFFTSLPHASKLLHRGQFMASLAQAPNSPNFPSTGGS